MKITELNSKPALDAEDIGFVLGPRLNAAGRLGQAQLAIELLTTDRPDRAEELAQYIHGLNDSRQKTRTQYLPSCQQNRLKKQFNAEEDAALVSRRSGLAPRSHWDCRRPPRRKIPSPDHSHRPGSTRNQNPALGSCRSVPGFNLHAALAQCTEYLAGHGGHAAAAGLTIDDHQIDPFRKRLLRSGRAGNHRRNCASPS